MGRCTSLSLCSGQVAGCKMEVNHGRRMETLPSYKCQNGNFMWVTRGHSNTLRSHRHKLTFVTSCDRFPRQTRINLLNSICFLPVYIYKLQRWTVTKYSYSLILYLTFKVFILFLIITISCCYILTLITSLITSYSADYMMQHS